MHYHEATRTKHRIQTEVFAQVRSNVRRGVLPFNRATLSAVRFSSRRRMDVDNLLGSLKWVIDGLVLSGAIRDDHSEIVTSITVSQQKIKKGIARLELTVQEI